MSSCQLTGNVATQTGGGISLIAGTLNAQARGGPSRRLLRCSVPPHNGCSGSQDVLLSGNTAGKFSGTTGLGGGIYMADSCSSGVCAPVVASLLNTNLSDNYAHLVTPPLSNCAHMHNHLRSGVQAGHPLHAGRRRGVL